MCRSSSCRFMKYHGAFDGFGRDVRVRLVQQRRVEHRREHDERDREQDGADELDEDEIRPDEQLLVALALLADGLSSRRPPV